MVAETTNIVAAGADANIPERDAGAVKVVPRLALSHVSHRYGDVLAVDDVSLQVGAGELVCLLGPSGCGKSTTLRIAAGLEKPHAGQVFIDGAEVVGEGCFVPPEKRGVGLMFQDYALFPHMSVARNVGFGVMGVSRAERDRIVMQALRIVGMERYADAFPHTLSGGEQQRVALARALAPQPSIILMDEPFSGLDRRLRDEVREETVSILRQAEAAVLMVTHDPEEAMSMADRIALMRAGKLVQIGPPDELYFHPVDADVAEFFCQLNRLHAYVKDGAVATPWGALPAGGFAEGDGVEILFRPEQVKLGAAARDDLPRAVVERCSPLGGERLLQLRLCADSTRLRVRLPYEDCPATGAEVGVKIALSQMMIFPCRCGHAARA